MKKKTVCYYMKQILCDHCGAELCTLDTPGSWHGEEFFVDGVFLVLCKTCGRVTKIPRPDCDGGLRVIGDFEKFDFIAGG